MAHARNLRCDWQGGRVCGHGLLSVSWQFAVRVARKRYHPLCTLQAQGRMHVQMKAPDARASGRGGPRREELLTGF
jgi:hypothetical protein